MIPDNIAARQVGMRVTGIAVVTDVMEEDANPTTDEEVKVRSEKIGPNIDRLMSID